MDASEVRRIVGERLRMARGQGSVKRAGASGVSRRTIDGLERGTREHVDLSAVYLLAMHYEVDLARLLDLGEGVRSRDDLGTWRAGAPSLPATDVHLRREARRRRLQSGRGTPALAAAAGVGQAWLVRFEAGEVAPNLVHVARVADALGISLASLLPEHFLGVHQGGSSARRNRNAAASPAGSAGGPGPGPVGRARQA